MWSTVFEIVRHPAVLQPTGPALADLDIGQPRPFADVASWSTLVDHHRPDTELFGDDRRGLDSAEEVAGDDAVDGADRTGSDSGLPTAELGQHRVGVTLPSTDRFPLRLPVAHDEQVSVGHRCRSYLRRFLLRGWAYSYSPVTLLSTLARLRTTPRNGAPTRSSVARPSRNCGSETRLAWATSNTPST